MTISDNDTIAQVSTPPGSGGIGIIRISGSSAIEVADKIFTKSKNNIRAAGEVARMSSYTLKHGYIVDCSGENDAELIDEVLISVMRGPKSYTGEDVVEINSHGGYAVMKRILGLLFKVGARPAEPGEFTKRAFMNGRIDLSRAEAVSDIIQAKTEESRKSAFAQLSGRLSGKISEMNKILHETLAKIEVAIDYPEYEEDEQVCQEALDSLSSTKNQLEALLKGYERGRIVREGLRTSICGRPNAGKSSLLNSLLGTNRAIVTEIAGTTRDTIEEVMDLDGYTVILTDTAGIRETDDIVEKIGVERAREEIQRADLVVFLADGTAEPSEEKKLYDQISAILQSAKIIVAVNKTDLMTEEQKDEFSRIFSSPIMISVKNDGGDKITDVMRSMLESGKADIAEAVITGERHKMLVDRALDAIKRAFESAQAGMPLDFISCDIWECANALGEITGEHVTDDVIDTIFSKFCLGK